MTFESVLSDAARQVPLAGILCAAFYLIIRGMLQRDEADRRLQAEERKRHAQLVERLWNDKDAALNSTRMALSAHTQTSERLQADVRALSTYLHQSARSNERVIESAEEQIRVAKGIRHFFEDEAQRSAAGGNSKG